MKEISTGIVLLTTVWFYLMEDYESRAVAFSFVLAYTVVYWIFVFKNHVIWH